MLCMLRVLSEIIMEMQLRDGDDLKNRKFKRNAEQKVNDRE